MMIHKSIIVIVLAFSFAHAGNHIQNEPLETVRVNTAVMDNEKSKVWNAALVQKKSGESCDDGNCLEDLGCFTKDGPMYKAMTSVRDKIKKLCAKL